MPPVSDPNYFLRRAESGPERDNPLAPTPPVETLNASASGGILASEAEMHQAIQAIARDYAEAVTTRYPQLRNPWDFEVTPRPVYEPINTLHEKVAMACANDPEDGYRWSIRSERDRVHYRAVADRVLQLIPVPGARGEDR